ncbi:conjugative transposon protein TraM [Tenacibaculum adriaticum]|uniref:conjugative transposon protein TraM n=1 Tax=Tenacibaculum adriaticum TaxID=413713 RepID=UPI0029393BD6|nr:conjugative transposon protein TraM [Tenacibaculum adriaticum]
MILCVVLFIASYAVIAFGDNEEPTLENNQIPVPELKDEQKEYKSKLEALDDLKEVRQTNAPSIYDERLLDSTGVYDPDLLEKEKKRKIDSIYKEGRISYTEVSHSKSSVSIKPALKIDKDTTQKIKNQETLVDVKKLGLEHQLFFASNPQENENLLVTNTDAQIFVRVDGTQTVRQNYRLEMRLTKDATIIGKHLPKNTAIYGFVKFQPNRTMISIEHINHQPIKLTAHDFQDGSEGIYIENSFRADVRQQLVSDAVNDINIAGIPQVSGVKRLFQKNNRNVRVTIADNYQLILKLKQ